MSFSHSDRRLKAAFSKVPAGAKPRPDCPPPAHLWHAARGEVKPAELKQVILHLAECPLCTEAWRLAERLEQEGQEEEAPLLAAEQPGRSGRRLAAIAAAVFAVIGIGVLLRGPLTPPASDDPSATFRAVDRAAIERLELIGVEGLSRDDFLLRWQGPDDQDIRYRVQIMRVGFMDSLVEEQNLRHREYRASPELLQDLPAETKLSILIEARHPFEGRVQVGTFYVTLP